MPNLIGLVAAVEQKVPRHLIMMVEVVLVVPVEEVVVLDHQLLLILVPRVVVEDMDLLMEEHILTLLQLHLMAMEHLIQEI